MRHVGCGGQGRDSILRIARCPRQLGRGPFPGGQVCGFDGTRLLIRPKDVRRNRVPVVRTPRAALKSSNPRPSVCA